MRFYLEHVLEINDHTIPIGSNVTKSVVLPDHMLGAVQLPTTARLEVVFG